MEQRASFVSTAELTTAFWDIQRAAKQRVAEQRSASVPVTGLANNFDPDQKTFVTAPLKGYTMLQVGSGAGTYGALGAQADYGKSATRAMDDYNFGFAYGGLPEAKAALASPMLYPEPGQPNLIYPVAGNGSAFNTNFIRGGKGTARRYYFEDVLRQADGTPIQLAVRTGASFIVSPPEFGSTNTALPPGMRYYEPADYNDAGNTNRLPRDFEGVIRQNVKPLPPGKKSSDADIQADDTYWTGTVRDPVKWVDKNFVSFALDKVAMAAYLALHPGCNLF